MGISDIRTVLIHTKMLIEVCPKLWGEPQMSFRINLVL